MSKQKVFIIMDIPTPYRIPLLNQIGMEFAKYNFSLKIFFGNRNCNYRDWEIDLQKLQFSYEFLTSYNIPFLTKKGINFTYSGLHKALCREKPIVVISNGFSLATTQLWLYKFPYIIWSGAIAPFKKKYKISLLRTMHRKILVGSAIGFIGYGSLAKHYLMELGAKKEKVAISLNTTDTRFFASAFEKNNCKEQTIEKKRLLYIGRLTSGKRVDLLIAMAKELSKLRQDFVLNIVGDGPQKEFLQQKVQESKISSFVNFEGYKQHSELVPFLTTSNCFLFPSEYDIWGLVLVEAMIFGMPCIASIYSGATQDLIEDNITGFAMDFSFPYKVAKKVDWLLNHPDIALKIGEKGRQFIQKNLTIEKSANSFVKATFKFLECIRDD